MIYLRKQLQEVTTALLMKELNPELVRQHKKWNQKILNSSFIFHFKLSIVHEVEQNKKCVNWYITQRDLWSFALKHPICEHLQKQKHSPYNRF